jgi:hypothetical protein
MHPGAGMVTRGELLAHYNQLHARMLGDVKAWRSGGWRLVGNNEDLTERWLKDQQARADELASIIAADEKPPVYLYGAF